MAFLRLPSRWVSAVFFSLALAARPTLAGAPFLTDDPGVVELGHSELILFYQQTLAANGRSGVLPAFEFHYGAIERIELDVVVPLAFSTPPGERTHWGYGDTVLGVKYRVLEESETAPLVGFDPKLVLATGNADRGLGNGGLALLLPLWVQKQWGDFQTYGGGGYWINHGSNNRNYWFVGVEAQYRVSDLWTLGAEVFHTTPQTVDQRASTGLNAGGYVALGPHGQLLFSVGKGLQNAAQTNRVSSYIGYQLTY
jgi:hypothetical protein